MTLRETFDYLSTLSIPGVKTNYALDELPAHLPSDALPALVPMLFLSREGQDQATMQPLTYDELSFQSALYVEHIFYCMAHGKGSFSEVAPLLVDFVDDFMATIAADPDLGGTLEENTILITADQSFHGYPNPKVEFSTALYYAVRITQRWRLKVTVTP